MVVLSGGNPGVTAFKKLQKLQNQAAKLVTNSPFNSNTLPVIQALKWPTVKGPIDLEGEKMPFKSHNGGAPSYTAALTNFCHFQFQDNCDLLLRYGLGNDSVMQTERMETVESDIMIGHYKPVMSAH